VTFSDVFRHTTGNLRHWTQLLISPFYFRANLLARSRIAV